MTRLRILFRQPCASEKNHDGHRRHVDAGRQLQAHRKAKEHPGDGNSPRRWRLIGVGDTNQDLVEGRQDQGGDRDVVERRADHRPCGRAGSCQEHRGGDERGTVPSSEFKATSYRSADQVDEVENDSVRNPGERQKVRAMRREQVRRGEIVRNIQKWGQIGMSPRCKDVLRPSVRDDGPGVVDVIVVQVTIVVLPEIDRHQARERAEAEGCPQVFPHSGGYAVMTMATPIAA
jgi:hypothetical protein